MLPWQRLHTNTAVLGSPVRVDVVGRHVSHGEVVHGLVHRLGAESAQAQAAQVVLPEDGVAAGHRHQHPQESGARLEHAHAVSLDGGSKPVRR